LRERTIYLMVMDELWRTLKASVEMVDRVDEITRLNRQKVLGQVLITHTMDDLELSDKAATMKAWGFVERSEMVFLGGLADGEMGNLRKVFAMSAAETALIADWSVESSHSADDDGRHDVNGEPPPPPGQGKFLLKTGKKPGTPFEVVLTSVEKAVNNTNKGWAEAEARHRVGRRRGGVRDEHPGGAPGAGEPRRVGGVLGGRPDAGGGGCTRPARPGPGGDQVPAALRVRFRLPGDPVDAEAAQRYLAMSLDMTIVEGHGGPRGWQDGARDAVALRRRLDPVGLRLVRVEPEWP